MCRPMQFLRFAISAVLLFPCVLLAAEPIQQEVMLVSGDVISSDNDLASTIDVDADERSNVASASAVQIRSDRNYSLLQPIPQSKTTPVDLVGKSTQHDATSNDITVAVSNFEQGLRDNYTLAVMNSSSSDYTSLLVVLKIPNNCEVHQILPKPIAVTGSNVVFSIPELASNKQQLISIAATTLDGRRVDFPTKVFADISKPSVATVAGTESFTSTDPVQRSRTKAILASHKQTPEGLPVAPYTPVINNQPSATTSLPTSATDDKSFDLEVAAVTEPIEPTKGETSQVEQTTSEGTDDQHRRPREREGRRDR